MVTYIYIYIYIGNSLYGLQNMHAVPIEVQELIMALTGIYI